MPSDYLPKAVVLVYTSHRLPSLRLIHFSNVILFLLFNNHTVEPRRTWEADQPPLR